MAGDFPLVKFVSPGRCSEKPWDLWVSEIGHSSPRKDDEFAAPAGADKGRRARTRRRAPTSRLRADAMALHGQVPGADPLRAALCPLCGAVLRLPAAARHLAAAHAALPPPPAPSLKPRPPGRSRHKKELPPLPVEPPPPLARLLPPPEVPQFVEEPSTSAAGEVQVCVESGELPVVSIQDTDDLPLGENITDDIFAIMNSEGIESADDITNAADWKNIISSIGEDLNFSQSMDSLPTGKLYAPVETATLAPFSKVVEPPPPRQPPAPPTPPVRHSRSKTSKSKFPQREYDPNKHCGVVTAENPRPCTRSLTCKAHALSLRRTVAGRMKPFDTLLAEHRAARDAPPPAEPPEPEPAPAEAEPCWYGSLPRPLALCTFNAAAAGGAVTLGKRFATVRSSIKSALARAPGRGAPGTRARRPELRRLVAARAPDRRTNGHVDRAKLAPVLGLAFLDPLLADDKC